MLGEAVDENGPDHERGEREGDDDVARHREAAGDDPEQVEDEDEHEQREHEREEPHALLAGGTSHRRGDELVGHLGERLHPSGHERAAAGRGERQKRDDAERAEHEQRRVREHDLGAADMAEAEDRLQLELVDRIGHRRFGPFL